MRWDVLSGRHQGDIHALAARNTSLVTMMDLLNTQNVLQYLAISHV